MFDDAYTRQAVAELEVNGITFAPGLGPSELNEIELAVGAKVPPELRLFWQTALPMGDDFPKWRDDPPAEAQQFRDWVARAVRFDVEQAHYWHASWGLEPIDQHQAVERALLEVAKGPPMIRVYGHRYMTTQPDGWGNPVLSVWQMIDSIFYGYDLADYLAKEFKITRPAWAGSSSRTVPYWGDLFGLAAEEISHD